MQSDPRDQFVWSCDWSGWFYNTSWHGMNYTGVGAWLHILFIANGAAQMDRCHFSALPSPPQPPLPRLDLTKSRCNFGLECIGRLFVLHKRVWQHSFAQTWFTTTGWSRGNYPANLASLRFCTDSSMDYYRLRIKAWTDKGEKLIQSTFPICSWSFGSVLVSPSVDIWICP